MKELLCSVCKTGMIDFALDTRSPVCSYIGCLNNGKCGMFVPIKENESKDNDIDFNKINC